MDAGMDQTGKLERPDAYCAPDAAGGGQCPLNFCGQAKVGIPSNAFPQSGSDSLCGVRICKVGAELATGDGFQLVCVDPNASGVAFGAACSPDPAQGMRCADDTLCIAAVDFPSSPFCQRMCRNDDDCPCGARCLERPTRRRADGRPSRRVSGCARRRPKIAGTVCLRESGCPPGQGCVLYGGRTSLRICRAGGAKSLGTLCAGASRVPQRRVLRPRLPRLTAGNAPYCSGACSVNSDCGPDQGCVRLVVGNNGTPGDPLDDLVVGYCHTLFAPVAATGCASDAACVARPERLGRLRLAHGLCYKQGAGARHPPAPARWTARWGRLQHRAALPRRLLPDVRLRSPTATSGADACPGTNSQCAQRGGPDEPISACYEKCVAGGRRLQPRQLRLRVRIGDARSLPSVCLVGSGT